jgi:type I restriction enzyme R subunit
LTFIKAFRDLLRLQSSLKSFADFETEALALDEQTFEDFQSKYLDLHDRVKKPTTTEGEDKPLILDEVDFETELIQTDLINVAYIQNLLKGLCDEDRSDWIDGQEVFMQKAKSILDMAATDPKLRVKIPLLQKFVETTLPNIHSSEQFDDAYA